MFLFTSLVCVEWGSIKIGFNIKFTYSFSFMITLYNNRQKHGKTIWISQDCFNKYYQQVIMKAQVVNGEGGHIIFIGNQHAWKWNEEDKNWIEEDSLRHFVSTWLIDWLVGILHRIGIIFAITRPSSRGLKT